MTTDDASLLLGIDTRVWLVAGQALLALAAVVGGALALHNHRRAKRREEARWLHGVFRDFYLGDKFEAVREQLEYSYAKRLGPLLERRIADREVRLKASDKRLLRQLDTLLIYIDHVLYLRNMRQIDRSDVEAIFLYWIELMAQPEHASLRCYVRHFKFRRVADELNANEPRFVALCGPPDREAGRRASACTIGGRLRELDGRAVLVAGAGEVEGRLLELGDGSGRLRLDLLRQHDLQVGYDAGRDDSPSVRRLVRLVSPPCDAWVYLYGQDPARTPSGP